MSASRHVYRIYIRATQDTVWQAITDPAFTRRYFHDTAIESSLQPGKGYRYVLPGGDDALAGDIEEVDPPNRLVMTFRALYDPAIAAEPPSRVEWSLEPGGDGVTMVTLVHGDLGASPRTSANVSAGWVWILDSMKTLLETGEPLPPAAARSGDDAGGVHAASREGGEHRRLGIEANNAAWELLGRDALDADESEELIRRAYASAYHWARVDGAAPENEARAEYMIGKAHVKVGNGEMAAHHARRCLAATTAAGLKDFDLAYAHEIMARGLMLVGDHTGASEHRGIALAVPIDDHDRALVESDLADLADLADLTDVANPDDPASVSRQTTASVVCRDTERRG